MGRLIIDKTEWMDERTKEHQGKTKGRKHWTTWGQKDLRATGQKEKRTEGLGEMREIGQKDIRARGRGRKRLADM